MKKREAKRPLLLFLRYVIMLMFIMLFVILMFTVYKNTRSLGFEADSSLVSAEMNENGDVVVDIVSYRYVIDKSIPPQIGKVIKSAAVAVPPWFRLVPQLYYSMPDIIQKTEELIQSV